MLDMPETPQLPEEVQRNRDVAKQRTEQLQGIFVSQHAVECEALHERLRSLDTEEASLRSTLAALQLELDEATDQRRAKDGLWDGLTSAVAESPDAVGSGDGPRGAEAERLKPAAPLGTTPSTFSSRWDLGGAVGQAQRLAASSRDNPLSPILSRRRAEARSREATASHDASMAQMRASLSDIERRVHKQQCWMKHVDQRVLEAEIEKVRVRVRLDTASQRSKSLSKDLSSAYDNVVKLLDVKLTLQDTKARNEALLAYLDVVGKANVTNEAGFLENRAELCQVLRHIRARTESESQLEALVEQLDDIARFAEHAQQECQDVVKLNSTFQSEWSRMPSLLKDSRLTLNGRRKVSTMHPVTAMQTMSESLGICSDDLKDLCTKLSKALHHEEVEMRPQGSIGRLVPRGPRGYGNSIAERPSCGNGIAERPGHGNGIAERPASNRRASA